MNLKYVIVVFFLFSFIITCYFVMEQKNNEIEQVRETFSIASHSSIRNYHEAQGNMEIDIYYPVTNVEKLDEIIEAYVHREIENFKSIFQNVEEYHAELKITFNEYQKENIIAFAFTKYLDTGGAHPNTYTHTINFNTKTDQVITIEDLVEIDSNLLNSLSTISRESLQNNENIVQYGVSDFFYSGTEPKIENFQNFVLDEKNFIIFFDRYSIAPYVAGDFIVKIPYEKLNMNAIF